jgi:hypothetical protein
MKWITWMVIASTMRRVIWRHFASPVTLQKLCERMAASVIRWPNGNEKEPELHKLRFGEPGWQKLMFSSL